jgi:perosamine synthetase
VAEAYCENLARMGFGVPNLPSGSTPAYVRFPVMVEDRDVAMRLASRRVVLGQWFNSVLEESIHPSDGEYVQGSCPRAEYAAEHLVNLPTHLRIKPGDVQDITALFAEIDAVKAR